MSQVSRRLPRPFQLVAIFVVAVMATFALPAVAANAVSATGPVINSITPNLVSINGGKTVDIIGTNLLGDTQLSETIKIDGIDVTNSALLLTNTKISVPVPAHAAGTVDVVDTTTRGNVAESSDITNADKLTYTGNPIIYSVTPNSGPAAGGNTVTVLGANLTGAHIDDVTFGGAPGGNATFSANKVTIVAPAHVAGTVDIIAITDLATSAITASDKYTFTGAPIVSGVTPDSGPIQGGTTVTITGNNFVSDDPTIPPTVIFGGVAGHLLDYTNTTIHAVSPGQIPLETVDITVSVADGGLSAKSQADKFTYLDLAPIVTKVTPNVGPLGGNNTVTIYGENFDDGGYDPVLFGNTFSNSAQVKSDNTITAVVPPGVAGTVDVMVQTQRGTSTTSADDHYTYTKQPVIYSVTPDRGKTQGGYNVTVVGANLISSDASHTFYFGSTAGFASDTEGGSGNVDTATVQVPAHGAGTVDVTDVTSDGTSVPNDNDKFTYEDDAPTVTGITPNTGNENGGDKIKIQSTNFYGDNCGEGVSIYIDGKQYVTSYSTDASGVTFTTPAHEPGTVDIQVGNLCGISPKTTNDRFTFLDYTPVVTSVKYFLTGDVVPTLEIDGSYLLECLPASDAPTVYVGSTQVGFEGGNDNLITTSVPTGLSPGTYNVTVTTDCGTSAITAASQYVVGGTTTTTSTTVPVATSTTSTTIVTTTSTTRPATTTSTTRPTTTTSTTLKPKSVPTVTNVSPAYGSVAGGTTVNISGTNFTKVSGVSFNGVAAKSFKVNSSTSITAVTPAHSVGTVDIKVTTATGISVTNAGDRFTYNTPSAPAPGKLYLNPNHVAQNGNADVYVQGANLGYITSVKVDGKSVGFRIDGSNELNFWAPAHKVGSATVTVSNSEGSSSTTLNYTKVAAPQIYSVSPQWVSSWGGTQVAVWGQDFLGTTSVTVDGKPVSYWVQIGNDDSIHFAAPRHGTGNAKVVVTTPSGSASATLTYYR